ncbi:MAG: ROK family protein [Pirellulaceae bacterium]
MSGVFAGVDLGGTTISAALADAHGEILREAQIATESQHGPDGVIERIASLLKELTAAEAQPLQAVGVGAPGLVDTSRGVTRFLPNLPTNWRDVPMGASLRERLGVPVYLLNDVRAATLGELTFGHGMNVGTMAFFSVGTGVGGGVVVDGRLRLGPLGAAGELGHQTILPDGPTCGCGNRGCLEVLASGPAIVGEGVWLLRAGRAPILHELVEGDVGRVTPKEMAAAAEAGDAAVREVIVRAAGYLGIGVANVVTVLHPELVVIGGGVAEMGSLLLDVVRDTLHARVGMFPTDDVRVERSKLGAKAGVLGAIALASRGGVTPL